MHSASAYNDSLFAPEVLLPSQFFSGAGAIAERPEILLMRAVLQDAITTLLKHTGNPRSGPRRRVREVEEWINARHSDWPFSFENICAVLGLDAAALRAGLRRVANAERAPLMALPIGRRVVSERHRVSAPRSHRRAAAQD